MFISYCCFLVEKGEKEKKNISFLSFFLVSFYKKTLKTRQNVQQRNAANTGVAFTRCCIYLVNATPCKCNAFQVQSKCTDASLNFLFIFYLLPI